MGDKHWEYTINFYKQNNREEKTFKQHEVQQCCSNRGKDNGHEFLKNLLVDFKRSDTTFKEKCCANLLRKLHNEGMKC